MGVEVNQQLARYFRASHFRLQKVLCRWNYSTLNNSSFEHGYLEVKSKDLLMQISLPPITDGNNQIYLVAYLCCCFFLNNITSPSVNKVTETLRSQVRKN